jgi:hypothetical protein
MTPRSDVQEFFESARNHGATDEVIVALLRGRGWPEEDVYRALADNFEARSGLSVPAYKRSGSAKDAFLYLLSFATLATWAVGLGQGPLRADRSLDQGSTQPQQLLREQQLPDGRFASLHHRRLPRLPADHALHHPGAEAAP